MISHKAVIPAVVLAFGAPSAAVAAPFDGTQPLLCAAMQAYDCAPGGECISGMPADIDAPQFIRLDFETEVAQTTKASGINRTAAFDIENVGDQRLVLQGVQRGLGWSLAITQATGSMTLTVSGDDLAFVVFGACTPL